jgi:hypothetical protein
VADAIKRSGALADITLAELLETLQLRHARWLSADHRAFFLP